jgi:hypothetical protein
MNFYYDPILGLEYDCLENLILLDIEVLPENFKFDLEYWLKHVNEIGVYLVDKSITPPIENITTFKL